MKRLLLIAAFAALTSAQGAFAWGRLGHAAVARLAEQHLTKKAKANLDKLLDGRSIVYYASWMDDYKPQMLVDLGYTPTNGPRMHMLPHTFSVDESGEVIRGNRLPGDKYLANCLYYVERAADQLKNRMHEMNDSTRLACIQVIVHCLGDMHCPAHIKYATHDMKYDVLFEDKYRKAHKFYVHSVWDNEIITTTRIWSVTEWADELDRASKREKAAVQAGTPRDWLHDSAVTCEVQFEWAKPDERLGQDFLNKALPLVEHQIRNAGYRLAAVLNELFD